MRTLAQNGIRRARPLKTGQTTPTAAAPASTMEPTRKASPRLHRPHRRPLRRHHQHRDQQQDRRSLEQLRPRSEHRPALVPLRRRIRRPRIRWQAALDHYRRRCHRRGHLRLRRRGQRRSPGGFSDWRIPNIIEFFTLLDFEAPSAMPNAAPSPTSPPPRRLVLNHKTHRHYGGLLLGPNNGFSYPTSKQATSSAAGPGRLSLARQIAPSQLALLRRHRPPRPKVSADLDQPHNMGRGFAGITLLPDAASRRHRSPAPRGAGERHKPNGQAARTLQVPQVLGRRRRDRAADPAGLRPDFPSTSSR